MQPLASPDQAAADRRQPLPASEQTIRRRARWRGLISALTALGAMLAALTLSLGAAGSAQAADFVIDSFSAPAPSTVSVLTTVGERSFNDFTATVPGGVRGIYHHTYTNPLGSVTALSVGNGLLSSSSGVQAQTEVLALYGAFTRPTLAVDVGGPRLGLDFSAYNAFQLDFTGATKDLNLVAVLYTANPLNPIAPLYYSTAAVNVAPAAGGGALNVTLPFSLSDPFNFAQVDGIALVINRANGNTGIAFNLDTFSVTSAVPEPPQTALLFAGLLVMAWLGRRHLQLEARARV